MEQLIQHLKNGNMELMEVPLPAINSGQVMVRNLFSVISSGTEGKTVKDARLGYIAKARARKSEVQKVIKAAKTNGLLNTYRMVMNKLDAPSPLGYSCCGEVIAVAADVTNFRVGDIVACGGNTANHAEVVVVPEKLCVKVPENVMPQQAAFTTLGAIALQGIRQADLRLGETCVVIGLGLIGQLTIQMLAAAGIDAIGIDLEKETLEAAKGNGACAAFHRNDEYLIPYIEQATKGYGVDAVIITAGTSSTDPVNLAGELCRKKGKVVVVGAVNTGFDRQHYFKKELDLRMSSSYGPGRYDPDYEEHGNDYPYGYVRWTENRNMEAFVSLIAGNKIDPAKLISKIFPFQEAKAAYEMVVSRNEFFMGLVLQYNPNKPLEVPSSKLKTTERGINGKPAISFIGAGSFAQNFLLPAVSNENLRGVVTARTQNAVHLQNKYGFVFSSGDANEIFSDAGTNTIFIATRHHTHAGYVKSGLEHHKNIFVEKPLCMSEAELHDIAATLKNTSARLMVGFNRRFSPAVQEIKSLLSHTDKIPVAVNYRINAGIVAPEHWIHDPEVGGGRLIGEACHFIDLAAYISGAQIESVSAVALPDVHHHNDTFVINLSMSNGSIASISYFSNGNASLPKERIEVFSGGNAIIVDDFTALRVYGKKSAASKKFQQDKGHAAGVKLFLQSISNGTPNPIPFSDQFNSMLSTFKAVDSIALKGERLTVSAISQQA